MQAMHRESRREQTQYVFEASEPEHARLVRLAGVMDPYVRDTCTRLGLAPGAKVIEVGCGPLGALLPLSVAVGPGGMVVGLDRSGDALDKARTILAAQGRLNVHLVQGDLFTVTPAEVSPSGPFDLAFCRFVLCYQRDAGAALRRMAALVRPGGHIVAQELVFTAPIPITVPGRFVPAANVVVNTWFSALLQKLGTQWDVAEQYSAVCREAGLIEVEQRIFVPALLPEQAHLGISIYYDILRGLSPLLRQHGLASEEEIGEVLAALQGAQEEQYAATVFTHLQAELVARGLIDRHSDFCTA